MKMGVTIAAIIKFISIVCVERQLELEDSSCDRAVDSIGIVFDPVHLEPVFCVYHVLGTMIRSYGPGLVWELYIEITLGYGHDIPIRGHLSYTLFNSIHCHECRVQILLLSCFVCLSRG